MSYLALARKYRPRRFHDLVGQDGSSQALINAINLKREPHCVIFTGVRGVGKTTVARIYAKALNCESGPTTDPCDQCQSCCAIHRGNHEDVLEIDGASNTGVDDVRALQETLGYVPQRSQYKIYIIDEVHMLSTSAFNALLKTLEEPPAHVVFIFATTELSKVPETIQSRCQTFHLQKINRQIILDRLKLILETEGILFEMDALHLIAREGRGSLRDALTILDQSIALGAGSVSVATLRHIVGYNQEHFSLELLDALLRKDALTVVSKIAEWDQQGYAMSRLVEELAKSCRNAFVVRDLKMASLDIQVLDLEEKERAFLVELACKANLMDLNRLFRTWVRCLDDLRHADLDRYVVENYALEWCLDPGLPDLNNAISQLSGSNIDNQSLPKTTESYQKAEASNQNQLCLKDRWKQQQIATDLVEPKNVASVELSSRKESLTLMTRSVGGSDIRQIEINDEEIPESKKANSKLNLPNIPIKIDEKFSHILLDRKLYSSADIKESVDESSGSINEVVPTLAQGKAILTTPFPSSWRELVDEWKKKKPLQARVLEETYVLEYSLQAIKLSVDPQSMAGAKLLHVEARKRLQAELQELFGFFGQLEIQPKVQISGVPTLGDSNNILELGESILEVRQRERDLARDQIRIQIEHHPITKELISRFGGIIESIELS